MGEFSVDGCFKNIQLIPDSNSTQSLIVNHGQAVVTKDSRGQWKINSKMLPKDFTIISIDENWNPIPSCHYNVDFCLQDDGSFILKKNNHVMYKNNKYFLNIHGLYKLKMCGEYSNINVMQQISHSTTQNIVNKFFNTVSSTEILETFNDQFKEFQIAPKHFARCIHSNGVTIHICDTFVKDMDLNNIKLIGFDKSRHSLIGTDVAGKQTKITVAGNVIAKKLLNVFQSIFIIDSKTKKQVCQEFILKN